jgi:hypothetical protein
MKQVKALLNTLPEVGNTTQVFMTLIDDDYSYNQLNVLKLKILYGKCIIQDKTFTPTNNQPLAILVTGIFEDKEYIDILYTKAIIGNIMPDHYNLLCQNIPSGIFKSLLMTDVIGNIIYAISSLLINYYYVYFSVLNQLFSFEYSQDLEYQYNGTKGLLSDSKYLPQLFQLLSATGSYYLNTYDLELYISQYIYFRLGIVCAVYLDEHINDFSRYWQLGISGSSELGVTTRLPPQDFQPIIADLKWTIFNSTSFSMFFRQEIQDLINRVSRADIGNKVIFDNSVTPPEQHFKYVGYTYKGDPRTIYGKCIEYCGFDNYPLNIKGYIRYEE